MWGKKSLFFVKNTRLKDFFNMALFILAYKYNSNYTKKFRT